MSLFKKLGSKYPQFKNLSANRFSLLNRKNELYPIVKQLRLDYDSALVTFANYPQFSNKTLSNKVFNFVKDNF